MTPTEQPEALSLADEGERRAKLLRQEPPEWAAELRRLHAEATEWSERACNLQHELNVALRERDQARFDLATSVRSTTEHGKTIMDYREAMRMALEALRLPCDRWNGAQTVIVIAAIKALEQRVGES